MTDRTSLSYNDLLDAFEWVSSGAPFEHNAYIDREKGVTHYTSTITDIDEDVPDDLDDATRYLEVPHKNDLDLGKRLALRFIDEMLPDSYAMVAGFFSRRGAYARFKDLLDREHLLQSWYDYEKAAIEKTLREWSNENNIDLT